MVGSEAVGGQPFERHVPAAVGRESTDALGGDRCAGVGAPHVLETESAVLPQETAPQSLEPVGKPGRLDRDGIGLRRSLQLDLGTSRLHAMPHLRGELSIAPRVDVIPDAPHARGERVAEFPFEHDIGAREVERQFAVVVADPLERAGAPDHAGVVRSGDFPDRPVAPVHRDTARHVTKWIRKAGVGHAALREPDPQ